MCKYFKKVRSLPFPHSPAHSLIPRQIFTCSHFSQIYVERCLPACKPGVEACTTTDASHDPDAFNAQLDRDARRSYFACFKCITEEANAERTAAAEAAAALEQDPAKRAETMLRQARYTSTAVKADANRKVAERKIKAERDADAAKAEALKAEKEPAARGEGMWIEMGSAHKKKGWGGHGRGFRDEKSAVQSAPPMPTFRMGVDAAVGGWEGKTGEFKKANVPSSANETGTGSGVGAWPRKILIKPVQKQRENWGWK
ncbi:hypothetical protein PSPO01_05873 [Paraphaeosphaeria sporulosa]